MRTINFSDARRHLKEVLDRVVDEADVTIITRRDADDVVVMSLSEYNSWKETDYLFSTPANTRHLHKSLAELKAGRVSMRKLIEPEAALEVRESEMKYVPPKSPRPRRKTAKKRG
jgi:antitoxin YefM